ncbi:MAG: GNAT family N-acetyltransferase [Actinomycetota bacterium]
MSAPRAPFVVRVATPEDVGAAGSVVAAAYLHDLQVSAGYVQRLRDAVTRAEQAVLLVAVDDERLLGSVTYVAGGTAMAQLAAPGEVELRMLGVDPTQRGRGVAEGLVRACVERARAEGHRRVVLSTQPQMLAAQRLYQRLGFVRQPDLDWVPEPDVVLLGYALTL